MKALIRIVGGAHRIKEIYDNYVREIKEYNNQIKHTGFYLMPVRKTVKKSRKDPSKVKYNYYYGRYWYFYISTKERGIYIYVGKEKPLESLPDPPKNPLEGVEIIYDGDDILIPEDQFEKVKDLFKGYTSIVEGGKKK
ncbi:MAG: hypothetical protein QXI22_01490 [Sulfolobales archaeon]